jgi:hypothetical protein
LTERDDEDRGDDEQDDRDEFHGSAVAGQVK